MGHRLAVVGSRDFDDFETFVLILDNLSRVLQIDAIISGGAKGVDSMAEHYAEVNGIPLQIFPAEWDKFGKSAGYKRNKTIWDNADMYLCIWDGSSKGTKHSIDMNKTSEKKMIIFNFKENKFVDLQNNPINKNNRKENGF